MSQIIKELEMGKVSLKSMIRSKIVDIILSGKKKIKQAHVNGYEILVPVDEGMGWKIYYLKKFEKQETNFIRRVAKKDWIYFDVGANVGYYTLLFSTLSQNGSVHSFEPIPLCCHLLNANVLLNNLNNIRVNNFAISNYRGDAKFSVSSKWETSSFIHTERNHLEKIIQVEVRKIDDYVSDNNIERIDFVKIDVEGAEKFVLEGSLETLSKKELQPKMFLMELYDLNFIHYHTSVDEIVKFLNSYGYNAFVISKEHPIPFTKEHYNIFNNVFFAKKDITDMAKA